MVGLRLDFTPAEPSHLRHVFVPRSPASPLESTAKRIRYTPSASICDTPSDSGSSTDATLSDPPPSPQRWMWYCHHCRTGYELGVTRRCLLDDHKLCYGQPIKKRPKKGNKKHRACQSEFDYGGWQSYGAWKRSQNGQTAQEGAQVERNCAALCDWPSQCRWARKQEQPVETGCDAAIKEAVMQTPEDPAAVAGESVVSTQQSADGPISKIYTVAQKLSSQWTSLLAPIEEESNPAMIADFLDLAKAGAGPTTVAEYVNMSRHDSSLCEGVPFIAPLRTVRNAGNDTPSGGVKTGFDFDFGSIQPLDEEAAPSLAGGLHDLVAGTVGIALTVPSTTPYQQDEEMNANGRRCVSAPPSSPASELQEQLQGGRRREAWFCVFNALPQFPSPKPSFLPS
ncbi:MAG: hypothetical protein Q9170_001107 [Blastenia crenularia]